MAWSSASLNATKAALYAADKPILLGDHCIRDSSPTVQWRTSGSWASGSDGTATTGPTSCLSDGFFDVFTFPTSGATTNYLIFDFGSSGVTFDSAIILGHNFASVGVTSAELGIADDNAYSSNFQTIYTWSPGSHTRRLPALVLKHTGSNALVYSSVRYLRLKMVASGSVIPKVGELILSTRRQLQYQPNTEYDPTAARTTWSEHVGATGKRTRYVDAYGQRLLSAAFSPDDSTYQADMLAFWRTDTRFGQYPFVWMPTPSSNPYDAPLMHATGGDLSFPFVGPFERNWRLTAIEQGDQFVALET